MARFFISTSRIELAKLAHHYHLPRVWLPQECALPMTLLTPLQEIVHVHATP
jgi:hypothetical protein